MEKLRVLASLCAKSDDDFIPVDFYYEEFEEVYFSVFTNGIRE